MEKQNRNIFRAEENVCKQEDCRVIRREASTASDNDKSTEFRREA